MKRVDLEGFLSELAKLTDKYDIKIEGCGCCGSPYLLGLTDHKGKGDNLLYDSIDKTYSVSTIYDHEAHETIEDLTEDDDVITGGI